MSLTDPPLADCRARAYPVARANRTSMGVTMWRRSITALAMLTGGGAVAFTALAWISARITSTLALVDASGGDFATRYLFGDGTAPRGALAVAVATAVLLVAGIATASVGYLRIATPGPSPLMIRNPGAPNPQPREMQLAFKGKY